MNPSGSEKTERGSKRRKGNEPSRAPSMCLPEGGGTLRGMGEKFVAHPITGTGSMTAHNRGTSPNYVGLPMRNCTHGRVRREALRTLLAEGMALIHERTNALRRDR
jgi:hypothetical protein